MVKIYTTIFSTLSKTLPLPPGLNGTWIFLSQEDDPLQLGSRGPHYSLQFSEHDLLFLTSFLCSCCSLYLKCPSCYSMLYSLPTPIFLPLPALSRVTHISSLGSLFWPPPVSQLPCTSVFCRHTKHLITVNYICLYTPLPCYTSRGQSHFLFTPISSHSAWPIVYASHIFSK